ncbi:hypothetical protein OG217_17740 [Streptomyces sp. NBC_01023]|uniref:hypothetical protein n=1 Tax=Streptomyces sp. NBC_01023 TaxID=2903724 RepID=UPI003869BBF3|nr:hypothetical protein OG217_17740 [Streptomyces sp. NBC_01023]
MAPPPVPVPLPVARFCTGTDGDEDGDDWFGVADGAWACDCDWDCDWDWDWDCEASPDGPDGTADPDFVPRDGEVPFPAARLVRSPDGVGRCGSGADVGGPSLLERTGCGVSGAPGPVPEPLRTGAPSPEAGRGPCAAAR